MPAQFERRHRQVGMLWLALLLLLIPSARASEPPGFEGFDAFVEQQLATWKIAGAAVAVVRDGEILFVKGYGLRDIEKRLPMTPESLIPIGSIAKSVATLSMAKLVRQGKLAWDRPVRDWSPDFRLADDWVSSQVTLRDMLTHRTSFNGHDWAWYGAEQTADELFHKMRHFELRGGLRERFQYSDLIYVAAGQIAARAAGMATWDDLVRRDVFEPLGMKSVGFTLAQFQAQPNQSAGHGLDANGAIARFQPLEAHWAGPAGGFLYASTSDMARYLAMLANGGAYQGVRIVEQSDLQELTTPRMMMAATSPYPETGAVQYGMGFTVRPYRGHTMISHAGTNNGWRTRIAWFPHSRSGVYVASNGMEAAMQIVLSNPALDRLLGVEPADWSGRAMQAREKTRATKMEAREKSLRSRKAGTRPSRELADFAGSFVHPGYGHVSIAAESMSGKQNLQMGFRGYRWPLEHVHYDVFEAPPTQRELEFDPLAGMQLQFLCGVDGEISSVRVRFEPDSTPVEFKKQ